MHLRFLLQAKDTHRVDPKFNLQTEVQQMRVKRRIDEGLPPDSCIPAQEAERPYALILESSSSLTTLE